MSVTRIPKPWGEEILFALTGSYAGKLLCIRAGESLSLQYHERKDETIYLHEGSVTLMLPDSSPDLQVRTMSAGEAVHLPPGTRHRIEALADSIVFEVSTPELDDVVRLEDRYGRVPGPETR